MAYEYNPTSARFDIPNPHRVENIFLSICTAVCLVTALVTLFDARGIYLRHDGVHFAKSIVAAVGLLTLAISYAFTLMRQLRFFFGRGQPADLVPKLDGDDNGFAPSGMTERQLADATVLRQTLQQNAITYRVPAGPFENLLYTLVRNLVYSPRMTQRRVMLHFRHLLGIVLLLVLFPVSLGGIHNAAAVGWIGVCYFVLTNVVVLAPLARGDGTSARLSQSTVIAFIAAAIVAPVICASLVPQSAYPLGRIIDVVPLTFLNLLVALVVTALVFAAGIANTIRPSQIAIAPFLATPSVNTPPAQIYTELARELQRMWEEQIPNRRYMRILPAVIGRQGTFEAHVIEETQPVPIDTEPITFERALSLPTTRPLLVADAACTLLTIVGAILVGWASAAGTAYTTVAAGGALLVVANFGIRSANDFWRRFEFTSRLYWVEWNGNFSIAGTKIGAILTDRVQSEREIVNVEAMTLRVWAAEIDSIAYNTDKDRDLVAIRGLPVEAERLCRHLAAFAEDQGTIVAPTSPTDRSRIDALNVLNAKPPPAPALADLPTAAMPSIGAPAQAPRGRFCTTCGRPAASADAAFCGSCGTRLP